jgi:glucokinase
MQVEENGEPCNCGSRGCVETFAGAAAWTRLGEKALASGRPSALRLGPIDPRAVATAAQAGDPVALEIIDEVARGLGIGISASLLLLNVERVVIGGGISKTGSVLLDPLIRHVRKRIIPDMFDESMLRLASLGNDAGVIGAARVAMLGTGVPAG